MPQFNKKTTGACSLSSLPVCYDVLKGESMKKKFKIMYPNDHFEEKKRGKPYQPPPKGMVVMNGGGVFFLFIGEDYYPSIRKLSDALRKYDVVWKEA